MRVTAEAARRFLVARHALAPARSLEPGPDAVLEVFRRWGSIQFDPLAIAGRSHDLVLHARVAEYEPAWCDLLYERRKIFEAFNKGLSLVAVDEYPWFRGTLSRNSPRLLAENADVAERVLERIRAEGPMSSLDFESERGPTLDWFGERTNIVRAVLEAYNVTGVLGLARRDGNRRYYDVIERLLPENLLAREIPIAEQSDTSFSLATALMASSVWAAAVTFSAASAPPSPIRGSRDIREDGLTRGADRHRRARSGGGRERTRQAIRGESGRRPARAPPKPPPTVAFLSPFDPLVWDRALLGSLFEFDYVWELFSRRPSDVGAGTCCRCSFATGSSAGSNRASTAPAAEWRCSASGGRTASSRAAPRASSTRCATRSAPTSASQARPDSSGRRISHGRGGLFLTRP